MSSAASTHRPKLASEVGKPLKPHITGSSKLCIYMNSGISINGIIRNKKIKSTAKKRREIYIYIRGHVIANSEERESRRSGAYKTNESIGIVNGGGVEKSSYRFGEAAYGHEH
jgi:hypothetical protein